MNIEKSAQSLSRKLSRELSKDAWFKVSSGKKGKKDYIMVFYEDIREILGVPYSWEGFPVMIVESNRHGQY